MRDFDISRRDGEEGFFVVAYGGQGKLGKERGILGYIAQMIERMFAQFRRDVIARQISRADEEGESLRPRVVWGFALGLDVQVAVFHGAKFPLSWQERG